MFLFTTTTTNKNMYNDAYATAPCNSQRHTKKPRHPQSAAPAKPKQNLWVWASPMGSGLTREAPASISSPLPDALTQNKALPADLQEGPKLSIWIFRRPGSGDGLETSPKSAPPNEVGLP